MTDIPIEDLQLYRQLMAEDGFELTPDEVLKDVVSTFRKIRRVLRKLGWTEIPKSDMELVEMLKTMGY